MILILLVVFVAVTLFGGFILCETDCEFTGSAMIVMGSLCFMVTLIATIVLLINVSGLKVIDNKIAMYTEENAIIETQIAETVKQYQEYEKEVFTEVSPESSITLVALYPELKADTLVQKQIEIYVANNEKIKELKEQKISGSVMKWWLYFGG